MTLKEYLTERLGKTQADTVLRRAKTGETIVFSGPPATGKTTMVRLLREAGYKALDTHEAYLATVDKPLKEVTPHGFIEANFAPPATED